MLDQTKKAEKSKRGRDMLARLSTATVKSRYLTVLMLLGICTLLYYFGDLVDFFGWSALRWEFFYMPHDALRLFFVILIICGGLFLGRKGAVITTIISVVVCVPRALFESPYPGALFRTGVFSIVAGIIGLLVAMMRDRWLRVGGVAPLRNESDGAPEVQGRIEGEVFMTRDLEVDLSRRLIKHGGQIVKFTPTEYKLFSCLVRNNGKVMSHMELLRCAWGPEYGQENEYLHTFIGQLRRKIEDDPAKPEFILTEPGVGYRFVECKSPPALSR